MARLEYKLYLLKSPARRDKDEIPHATEEKLLTELAAMDEDGWGIAFVFPSGTHILMSRERPDWPAWKPDDKKDDSTASGGKIETDPKKG